MESSSAGQQYISYVLVQVSTNIFFRRAKGKNFEFCRSCVSLHLLCSAVVTQRQPWAIHKRTGMNVCQ